ncbi:unnamed protein product [Thlaspi arvense]|uniref:Uncharacterized protein n=1 Tax=Thlaspi arvense TaxID=13288 RepID=A0AAU9RVC4_THLAR|nr:unnamed protein product [Thlaspi arvense]
MITESDECRSRRSLVSDLDQLSFGDLLALANARSVVFEGRGEAATVKLVEETKPNNNRDPSDGCRRDRLCEIKYVRKKRVRSTSVAGTCNLAKKPKCILIPHILQIMNKETRKRKRSQRKSKPKKNWGSSLGERREGKRRACGQMDCDEDMVVSKAETEEEEVSDVFESEGFLHLLEETETEEDDVSLVSESEDCLPLLEEAETEENDVSDVSSSCNWLSFPTQPRTSKGMIRHVQWSNKKKRNCMTCTAR